MKVTTSGFKLTIDLGDLVESLDKNDVVKLARLVAADKQLFAAVLECVASESRVGGYFADAEEGEWWFGSEALLELREKLLPMMPSIARGAVEAALQQRNSAKADQDRYRSWAFALYHAWPDSHFRTRPAGPPDWRPAADATTSEIDALMSGKAVTQ